jgi:hemerythrin-like domain-containing protein
MPEMNQPNVADQLNLIHQVITRGLHVSQQNSQTYSRRGFPDAVTRRGFGNYVRAMVSVLRGHHLSEDELAFPYLQAIIPEAPYDRLAADHQLMETILPEVETLLAQATTDRHPARSLDDLNQAVSRIDETWGPHIQVEERHFNPAVLANLIPPAEHARLLAELGEHSQKHTGPDYLVLPFVLFNLPEAGRAQMARGLPPVVTEQLLPGAWKEKWASMAPFFLN